MLNINELERQWSAYKKRKNRPYIIASVSIIILGGSLAFFLFPWHKKVPHSASQPQTVLAQLPRVPKTPKAEPSTASTQSLPEVIKPVVPLEPDHAIAAVPQPSPVQEEPLILQPSFAFMQDIQPQQTKRTKHPSKKKKKKKRTSVNKGKTTYAPVAPHEQTPVSMTSTSSDSKLQALTKRFEQSKNPSLGIVIARLYFDKKAYALAYKYALEVNAINQDNIHSWLISAKSLYFLGKKVDAVNLLQTYIQKTQSSRAQKLLTQIQNENVQ